MYPCFRRDASFFARSLQVQKETVEKAHELAQGDQIEFVTIKIAPLVDRDRPPLGFIFLL